MLPAHRQHVRVQVNMSGARTRHRECESDHLVTGEGSHYLPSHFFGDYKHAERHQFRVGKIPHFFLEGYAGAQFLEALAMANDDRIGTQRNFSWSLACCHSDSSSSIVAWVGVRPVSDKLFSIHWKRRLNFRLVLRSADSGSSDR